MRRRKRTGPCCSPQQSADLTVWQEKLAICPVVIEAFARKMGTGFVPVNQRISDMIWAVWVVLILAGAVFLGLAIGRWRARTELRRLLQEMSTKPWVVKGNLPEEVRAYAARCGATGTPSGVYLTQNAEMELSPGAAWQRLLAQQWIDVTKAGFVWQARQTKAGLVWLRVIDAYVQRRGQLIVRLLGAIPVVRAKGPEVDVSEAMRFLAELPWAPDAILANPDLRWAVPAPNVFRVTLHDVSVDLILNKAGDVVEMRAKDRPALENGQLILREWRGVFSDHKTLAGRRIPTRGEVGYMRDGQYQPYYRGTVTAYELRH